MPLPSEPLWDKPPESPQVAGDPSGQGLSVRFPGDKSRQLIYFSRNVATMLQAGLPLEQVLHRQQRYVPNGPLRDALAYLHQDIVNGISFSQALGKHPELFDEFYRGMIELGEESGQLEMALKAAAEALERFLALRRKLGSALIYPVFVVLVALFDAALFLNLIIPSIVGLFKDVSGESGGGLLLLAGLTHYWWALPAFGVGAGVGAVCFFKTAVGREILDELVLYIPLLNETIRMVQSSYFIIGLGLGYQAGLPLEQAVRLATGAITNRSVRSMFTGLGARLQSGAALGDALAEVGYLPGMVLEMVDAGEVSGTLQTMLGTASEYLEQETDARLELFMALLKPLLLVMVALVIGSVILLIYTSVFATVGGIMQQAIPH